MAVEDIAGLFFLYVSQDGLAPYMSVILLVGHPGYRCMTDKDIHVGEFAEFQGRVHVVPFVRPCGFVVGDALPVPDEPAAVLHHPVMDIFHEAGEWGSRVIIAFDGEYGLFEPLVDLLEQMMRDIAFNPSLLYIFS